MATHLSESTKHVGDALSVVTVVGTLMQYLPAVAALLTIIWTLIRIWETDTVQLLVRGKILEKGSKNEQG
jgi:hypothetical protein